ncbi:TPA: tail fiber protein [Escherichia coli]|nr:tail fiber protein [Escherichia coli]
MSGKDVAGLLAYLGLGEGSALPVGVPVPWPSATPPTGWLKCNGAAFDKVKYPHLATAYPSGKLPDLRGEFIRGWDDGRGIDAGRALLSIQTGMLEKHRHIVVANDGYDSKEEWELATIFRRAYTQGRGLDATDAGGTLIPSPTLHTRGSIGNTGGSETRPRNIAFNYIVRAA